MMAAVSNRKAINRDALAIGVATGAYGVSFGVLAVAAGLDAAKACAMSLLVFTGASQFAVIGVLGAGGGVAAALAPALLLASRNLAYGLSMAPILRGSRRGAGVAVAAGHRRVHRHGPRPRGPGAARHAFLATGISVFVLWNLGTLVGALAGEGLGDPRDLGLDAMFPAAFLALLAPQLRRPGAPQAAIAGAVLAVALLPVAPAGVPVLVAAAGGRARRARGPAGGPGRGDRVSWAALLGLAAAAYLLKAAGPLLAGGREMSPRADQVLALLSVPLLAALVAVQTLDGGERIVIDARVPAMAVAGVLVWRRAPFLVVVLAAAATAALLRAAAA